MAKREILHSQIRGLFNENAGALSLECEDRGYVYFIEQNENIKIGTTKNLKRRILALQTGSATDFVLKYTIATNSPDNGKMLEKKFHKLFASYKIRREFFKLSDTIMKTIIEEHQLWLAMHPIERNFRTTNRLPYMQLWEFAKTASLSKDSIMSNLPDRFLIKTGTQIWIASPTVALRYLKKEGIAT